MLQYFYKELYIVYVLQAISKDTLCLQNFGKLIEYAYSYAMSEALIASSC